MADLNLSGHTILVVDDEQFSRSIITRLLERMGHPKIHTAEDGTEALALLKSFPEVSFIVSDFKMPLLDGLLLLRCVRSGEASIDRATPFAMVTGFSDNALVDTAIDLDVNAFLIKPVSSTALSRRLSNMLSTASDGSWLKPAEEYLQIEVNSAADPKRGAPKSAPTGSAPQRPTVHGRRQPAVRARPSAKMSAQHKK